MSSYVCSRCGYHKTINNRFDTLLGYPVYPSYDATLVMPFVAREYVQGIQECCPGCGKNTEWTCID